MGRDGSLYNLSPLRKLQWNVFVLGHKHSENSNRTVEARPQVTDLRLVRYRRENGYNQLF